MGKKNYPTNKVHAENSGSLCTTMQSNDIRVTWAGDPDFIIGSTVL